MATQNLTRVKRRHQKQDVSVFTTDLDYTDEIGTSADVYELFELPPGVMVTHASIFVLTASDAATSATADLGFDGGDTLVDGGNLKSAANTELSGGTNAVVPAVKETGGTVTFKPTYTGATTAGKFKVRVEYIEYEKTTGEVTNFSTT